MSELRNLAAKIDKLPVNSRERTDLEDLLDLRIAQLDWEKGRKDATFAEIVAEKPPGYEFKYQKGLSAKANTREKRALVKYDLATNYRRTARSLILRRNIIKRLTKSCLKYHALFGRYGYEASFRATFNTDRKITTTHQVVKNMEKLIDKMIKGYEYSSVAFSMRSPYQGVTTGPLSLIGMYKPVSLTKAGKKWLSQEPGLKSIKDYVGKSVEPDVYEDTYISSGIITPYTLEMLIRQTVARSKVLYSIKERAAAKKTKKRLPVRYNWTPLMKKLFPSTEPYLLNQQIKRFAYTMIDKNVPVTIQSPYDPLNQQQRVFLDEMDLVSSFIDDQIERRERKTKEKALQKQPELIRRKRKEREYEDVD